MGVARDRLVAAFSDFVGREKAEDVIETVGRESGLDKDVLTEEEALELSARIANETETTTFVRTAANTLQTRIRTGNL